MAAQSAVGSRVKPLTAMEYLERLRDDREVWICGERVPDVTKHVAFRNTARMLARLYDALHGEDKEVLCVSTDTGGPGYTHRFFRASRDATELVGARDAIAKWARMGYGWLGRSPDYKASFLATFGADPDFYAPFQENARAWYRKVQEEVTFVNHALVNPPVDRHMELADVRDVYMHVVEEGDGGITLSGAKVVATSAALTQYLFVANNGNPTPIKTKDFAFACMVPTNAPGVKLLCRTSYEMNAAKCGSPFDYPLSSRLDENDSILVFDRVLVPWENIFAYGDIDKMNRFFRDSGFLARYMLHGCTRLAVKLDFFVGVLLKAIAVAGSQDLRGVQVYVGELISWRHLFWGLSEAMARTPKPWKNGYVLPNLDFGLSYQVAANQIYPRVREIMENVLASGMIYLPSHAADFSSEMSPYLHRFLRGSGDYSAIDRVKVMKLIWDSVGSEFASRHQLYERNYFGSHESIRLEALKCAELTGETADYIDLAEQCMAEYDLSGWIAPDLISDFDGRCFDSRCDYSGDNGANCGY
jgi:4-hydroxyphenylacetate 3-monooxygenase